MAKNIEYLELHNLITKKNIKFINFLFIDSNENICKISYHVDSISFQKHVNFLYKNHKIIINPNYNNFFLDQFSNFPSINIFSNLLSIDNSIHIDPRSVLQQKIQKNNINIIDVECNFRFFNQDETPNNDFDIDENIRCEIFNSIKLANLNVKFHYYINDDNHKIAFSSNNILQLSDDIYKFIYILENISFIFNKKLINDPFDIFINFTIFDKDLLQKFKYNHIKYKNIIIENNIAKIHLLNKNIRNKNNIYQKVCDYFDI